MNEKINHIKSKLKKFLVRETLVELSAGLCAFLSSLVLMTILLAISENLFRFSSHSRTILFYLFIAVAIISFRYFFLLPAIKKIISYLNPDYDSLARKVGNFFPSVKDELVNALELIEEKNPSYSGQLIAAAFDKIYDKVKDLDFSSVIDTRLLKKRFRVLLILSIASVLLFSASNDMRASIARLINYSVEYAEPMKFRFVIEPGNYKAVKGEEINISIKTTGEGPGRINLYIKTDADAEFAGYRLQPDSAGIFHYRIKSILRSAIYYAAAEGIESEVYQIEVTDPPFITALDLTIIPPAYTKLPPEYRNNDGNVTALPGSRVNLKIESSKRISKAELKFESGKRVTLKHSGSAASGGFTVSNNDSYIILLKDEEDNFNKDPITYFVKTIEDEPPSIEMAAPDEDVKLNNNPIVPLIVRIKDDYGFSRLLLKYRLVASKYRAAEASFNSKELKTGGGKEEEVFHAWDLSPLVLAEGESVSYYLEVFDNDNINGPKSARTKSYLITVPSLDDLFNNINEAQTESLEELEETLKEAETLGRELQRISDDLKKNQKEISWQEKERIESAAERYKNLLEKAEKIADKISEMKNEMMKENLLSEETLKKYEELQKLMDDMNSEEMKEALRKLQESLRSLMRDKTQLSAQDLKLNEEYFKKSLERTINLLKRIQVEQKIDELIKRTENIAEKIDELQKKTEESALSDSKQRENLIQRQNDISQELENLRKTMENLDEKMEGLNNVPKEELERAIEEFSKQSNEKLSEEALEKLRQMMKSEALKNQWQLSSNMKKMLKEFQNLQNSMQQMNQVKTLLDMMKLLDDLLTLSKEQEKLKEETEKLNYSSPEFSEKANKQNNLQSGLNKILQKMTKMSQETFAITPEMGKSIGKAFAEMQNSTSALMSRNSGRAVQSQTAAMTSLNEAASMIKTGMDQMMNGGQGGGMMSLFQQLQQLSQQQMNLNQLTQKLQQGGLSQEMMSQLKRLAQEQELVRKSLEQLNREAKASGQSKRLASNLEKVLEEMKEVVADMQTEKLNDNLIQKQERILSRLLDAQRSINERDFEKNRTSQSGKNLETESPEPLNLSDEETRNRLRDELMKAVNEGYKKDYRELIKKYFEQLEKSGSVK